MLINVYAWVVVAISDRTTSNYIIYCLWERPLLCGLYITNENYPKYLELKTFFIIIILRLAQAVFEASQNIWLSVQTLKFWFANMFFFFVK